MDNFQITPEMMEMMVTQAKKFSPGIVLPTTPAPVATVAAPAETPKLTEQVVPVPVALPSKFKQIAKAAIARGENRALPIVVGAKKPAIEWVNGGDTRINTFSTEEWSKVADEWVETLAEEFPDLNGCVVAKPSEFAFVDCDTTREFIAGYESFSGEKFPVTYTTSARDNRTQMHFRQTDATRALGNVQQFKVGDIDLSVRQNNLYVLAEGSQHPTGSIYQRVIDAPIALMPDKLVEYIQSIIPKDETGKTSKEVARDEAGLVPVGSIHPFMLREAGKLRNMGLSAEAIYPALCELVGKNCEKPSGGYDYSLIKKMSESVENFPEGRPTELLFTQQPTAIEQTQVAPARYAMTPEEREAELEKEFPVIPLVEQAGPEWNDDIMYGIAGEVIRKASAYCEAHPAGMYLDLLIALGNIIGRGPYFNISQTRHYTNEFMARVGDTADSRKGTGRDAIDEVLKIVDNQWASHRIKSGFGSAESIVNELRDPMTQKIVDKKTMTGFREVTAPGIDDKRLCIREGELASVFQLASKNESRADIVLREGWDGKALRNLVKGRSKDGLSNSAVCQEPHLSISGDTTRAELVAKMPQGAAENGFGNRFLYCYVYRTKLCPVGGPVLDWMDEVVRLHRAIEWAKDLTYIPLTQSANVTWKRMYMKLDEPSNKLPGLAGKMTARAAAHIRRLALIFALLDEHDVVDTKHLRAAEKIWDYCQESARYIFTGTTTDQDRIRQFLVQNGPATIPQIRRQLFHDNKKAGWVRTQVEGLIRSASSSVSMSGDMVAIKK